MDTGILDVAAYSRNEMKLDIHKLMDPTLRKPVGECNCHLKFPHQCRLSDGQMKGDWNGRSSTDRNSRTGSARP